MTEKFSLKKFLSEHRRDLVLILSLILLAVILTLVFTVGAKEGAYVVVEIDGEEVGTYSLAKDAEYKLGDGNVLAIEGGKAYMKYADCPDKTCVHTGKISKNGQSIVCLTNRVSVTVVEGSGDGPDLVVS